MKQLFTFFVLMLVCTWTYAQVNTSVLSDRLEFKEGATSKSYLIYNGTDLFLDNNEIGGDLELDANTDMIFQTNNTTRMLLTSTGDLGLGTTTPDQKLDVNGDIALTDGTGQIQFKEGALVKSFLSYNGTILTLENNETNGDIYIDAADDVYLQAGGITRMFLREDGDIGIGTTNPEGKVEISYDSNAGDPQLCVHEPSGVDFARITMKNGSGDAFWDIAGLSNGTPRLNFYYHNGLTGRNLMSFLPDVNNVEVYGDITPQDISYDLGNNNSTEHWDDCVADDFINFSDKRLKKNIEPLENVLPRLMKLAPMNYQYIKSFSADNRQRMGFMAQDVQKIFPTVVIDEDIDVDKDGKVKKIKSDYLSMNYIELIPIAIKAIQEQQEQIEERDARIAELEEKMTKMEALEQRLERLEKALDEGTNSSTLPANTESDVLLQGNDQPQLKQNAPNPFHNATVIEYYLPKTAGEAYLHIADQQGHILKVVKLEGTGKGTVNLTTAELASGIYSYSLILDGKIVTTKQMVLTTN